MDMVKIGRFLAILRREKSLTQEQLGEQLGVTNKTISRWETGVYLPPVEMLLEMSKFYDVSLNELLAGERLTTATYCAKAEENLQAALRESAFSVQEKAVFFRKKWRREHRFEFVLGFLFCLGFGVAAWRWNGGLEVLAMLAPVTLSLWYRNREAAYLEAHLYSISPPAP